MLLDWYMQSIIDQTTRKGFQQKPDVKLPHFSPGECLPTQNINFQ